MEQKSYPPWFNDMLKLSLWMRTQQKHMKQQVSIFAKKHDLTIQQAQAMMFLLRHENILVFDFAEQAGRSSSTIVLLLNTLEEKGLIERERLKTDRRKVKVRLTEKGKKIAKHAPHKEYIKLRQAILSMTQEENDVLNKAFKILLKHVNEQYPGQVEKFYSSTLIKREFWLLLSKSCCPSSSDKQ